MSEIQGYRSFDWEVEHLKIKMEEFNTHHVMPHVLLSEKDEVVYALNETNTRLQIYNNDEEMNHIEHRYWKTEEEETAEAWGGVYGTPLWNMLVNLDFPIVWKKDADYHTRLWYYECQKSEDIQIELGIREMEAFLADTASITQDVELLNDSILADIVETEMKLNLLEEEDE